MKRLLAGALSILVGVIATVVGFSVYMINLMGRASDEDFFNE